MISRRTFLRAGTVLGTSFPLLAGMPSRATDEETLRVYYFGSADRIRRTRKVADVFVARRQGTVIRAEAASLDYWPKLTTMMASKNLPDIFTLEPTRFAEYVRRGVLLPLEAYLGDVVQTKDVAPAALNLGRVDGKLWAMPLSLNAFTLFYDPRPFAAAGIAPPGEETTWDDFARLCIDLTKAMGKKNLWASGNCARYMFVLIAWLIQRGKVLFREDGRPGFDLEDAQSWYAYWDALARNGGCTSAEIQALDNIMVDSNPMTTGNAVTAFGYSNQLSGFQGTTGQSLAMTTLPHGGNKAPSGLFYRPGMLFGISAASRHAETAARFIDFFVNDHEAGQILGAERGIPINARIRERLLPSLERSAQAQAAYLEKVAVRAGPYPPPFPIGISEFEWRTVGPVADRLAFGHISVTEAAAQLLAGATRLAPR